MSNNNLKPKYLTIKQLADYSNISVPTLRRYIRSKNLPYIRIDRLILVCQEEFDQWMNEHREEQESEKQRFDQIIREIGDEFGL